jgi:hypothetical protein
MKKVLLTLLLASAYSLHRTACCSSAPVTTPATARAKARGCGSHKLSTCRGRQHLQTCRKQLLHGHHSRCLHCWAPVAWLSGAQELLLQLALLGMPCSAAADSCMGACAGAAVSRSHPAQGKKHNTGTNNSLHMHDSLMQEAVRHAHFKML